MKKMNTEQCLMMLEKLYSKIIEKDCDFSYMMPFHLWGSPGLGKSTLVYELKDYIEKTYHKHVHLLDLRLYLYSPIDFKGIPYANKEHTQTIWLKPEMFHLDASIETINIIFLDELLLAKESVLSPALQLVLERRIDQVQLPSNTIIIAASNRLKDKSYTSQMSMALANRFIHIELYSDDLSWRNYAYKHCIDYRIIAFIQYRPSLLNEEIKDKQYVYATPRIWERVSYILSLYDDVEEAYDLISSILKESIALELINYIKHADELPKIEDVLNKRGKIVKKHDLIYLMISELVYLLRNRDLNDQQIDAIFYYVSKLPEDYILLFLVDIQDLTDDMKIISSPMYQTIAPRMSRYV